jgi:Putative Se/S carrier protein-like
VSSSAPTQSVLLVLSAAHGIKTEAAVRRAGITCALVPVPRTLSSQCGVCLRVSLGDRVRTEEILVLMGVEITAIHDLTMRPPGEETASE